MRISTRYDIKGRDGDSFRDRAERAGALDRLPDGTPPVGGEWYLEFFWGVRSMIASPETPVRIADITEYEFLHGSLLSRVDIGIIMQMDKMFRTEYVRTMADHEKRLEKV